MSAYKNIAKKGNRTDLGERFSDTTVRKNVEVDLALCDFIHEELNKLENHIVRHAIHVDARTFHRLQTVTGIGKLE